MPFIRARNVCRDACGNVIAGSAAIVDVKYDADAASGHSRQIQREKLGRIISLSPDKRSGVFLSPTRGLVAYNAETNEFANVSRTDPAVAGCPRIPKVAQHTRFGSIFLLLNFLQKEGLLKILRDAFPEDRWYKRALAHVTYGILRDGSSITCDLFVEQTALTYLLEDVDPDELRCDSAYFNLLGSDDVKRLFFTSIVKWMKDQDPGFGSACYIDATPLPNDISDNPYNALRCEKGKEWSEQMRLALVIDQKTGIPIWYEVFPGDQMDVNTLKYIVRDVFGTLGISIESFVLDSGYASKDLVQDFMAPGKDCKVIVRMPNRTGYPYKTLYHMFKDQLHRPKYFFVRKGNVYFGKMTTRDLFDVPVYLYVYVDHRKAQDGLAKFMTDHEDLFAALTDQEKRWYDVKSGYFVLLANIECRPEELLDSYLCRVNIETVIKDAKSFEQLMPLRKWTDRTVRGKILQDIFDTIIRARLLNVASSTKRSVSELFHTVESLECFLDSDRILWIGTPVKRARKTYNAFHQKVPASLELDAWKKAVLRASDVVPVF